MKSLSLLAIVGAATATLTVTGCDALSGTLIGAGSGAAAGAIAGNNIDGLSAGEGAIGGAVLGGVVGNVMGRQQEQIDHANAAAAAANQQVVYVQNSNGSQTPVTLVRVPSGWQGPRGEIYPYMPAENQLRRAYGF